MVQRKENYYSLEILNQEIEKYIIKSILPPLDNQFTTKQLEIFSSLKHIAYLLQQLCNNKIIRF